MPETINAGTVTISKEFILSSLGLPTDIEIYFHESIDIFRASAVEAVLVSRHGPSSLGLPSAGEGEEYAKGTIISERVESTFIAEVR